ncbi:uncharacterized protein LOC133154740 [Syngnathus typhle]|uniref:uncharacterized protein LOC133154740 n=1 Tax=Syngnathus typhle TaxID=161592 RepID=UPI002A6B42F5|nr:uncharacterized protein LOC133154740 [Syngnathus typhle]XP_061135657.1 uncharacterized protein LOC133154740 [Syngnathus typhle]XP_061135658.1 uncharacterized protein LOC133154740 [Syngnathus typhle]XP_061135659.1 uncharacterized protein LOC133154740 [Syngnathus typhle]XP_061135660.1 uncharacterized protein LOC133154740 [Syngnathus typhle]XP_061135661.1 uncharacterized protein LOC133154740 [Syngnathus typhle]XP_061135662.1 uncharacterized protein LOC133154740 [Syngnathus typhle]XP_06113566
MNDSFIGHPEFTQPPICSEWTQNGTVRLCFVSAGLCSKNFRLCYFRFGDIRHLFYSDDVTQPPTCLQMDPKWYRSFVQVCAAKIFVCATSVSEILDIYFIAMTSPSPPPVSKWTQNGTVRLCFVCAGLCSKNFRLCCDGFLVMKDSFIGHPEFTQPPICSEWTQNGTVRLCFVSAGLCSKKFCLCCFRFGDIRHLFYSDDVTQPPTCLQMDPKWYRSFVQVCAAKIFVCAASVSEILHIYFIAMTSGSPAPLFTSKRPKIVPFVRLCFVCAGLCCKNCTDCAGCYGFADITHLIPSEDVTQPHVTVFCREFQAPGMLLMQDEYKVNMFLAFFSFLFILQKTFTAGNGF